MNSFWNFQVWTNYEEPVEVQVAEEVERKTQYKTVGITEVTPHLHLYCQVLDNTHKLDQMTDKVRWQTMWCRLVDLAFVVTIFLWTLGRFAFSHFCVISVFGDAIKL